MRQWLRRKVKGMFQDAEDKSTPQQTGEELNLPYSERLLRQLRTQMARYDLDTPKTEELTALVSTVMESPSQNTAQQAQMLRDGLRVLYSIMSDDEIGDVVFVARAHTIKTCRAAFVIRNNKGKVTYRTYMR